MLNLKKSLKLAGVLAIALGAAAPVMTTAASAAPAAGHYDVQRNDAQRTAQNERGQQRFEQHGRFEHAKFVRHDGKNCHHGKHHEWRGKR